MKENSKTEKGCAQSELQYYDLLIRNAYVFTMDEKSNLFPEGAVAITGNTIVVVGPEREIVPRFRPKSVLNAGGSPVHPGFIDVHYLEK